jgi:ring-1,2-phenylacetyl-CoA epoxidase subunit PaaE
LLYGNQRASTVMFLDELSDLKDRYPSRFQLVHVLSQEAQDAELLSGRLDPQRLASLLDALVPSDVAHWYVCGPFAMVTGARDVLSERGVPAERVHLELFHVEDVAPVRTRAQVAADARAATVLVTLDGRTTEVAMATREESVLAATLRARPEAPFACRGGVCGTCRARVVEGEVRLDHNYALEPDELARGIVLACQAHPVTDRVVLTYDA